MFREMSLTEKRARASQAQEEKNEQYQRGVLNMMQLHPEGHVLAEGICRYEENSASLLIPDRARFSRLIFPFDAFLNF